MHLKEDWSTIKCHFNKSFSSNFYVSMATVNAQNAPEVTPIGTLFLNKDQTGYYFEKFTSSIAENARNNPKVCVLGVRSGIVFWIWSLFKNKFSHYPGIKLYGELGVKRKATPQELKKLELRMKNTQYLRGHHYLWQDMQEVREVNFSLCKPITLGKITRHL